MGAGFVGAGVRLEDLFLEGVGDSVTIVEHGDNGSAGRAVSNSIRTCAPPWRRALVMRLRTIWRNRPGIGPDGRRLADDLDRAAVAVGVESRQHCVNFAANVDRLRTSRPGCRRWFAPR